MTSMNKFFGYILAILAFAACSGTVDPDSVKPEEPVMVALHNAAGKLVSSMPNKTSAATLVGERKSSCVAVPEGGRPHSVVEVWSLDIKGVEDVMFRLSSDVTPIFATEATSGLRGL